MTLKSLAFSAIDLVERIPGSAVGLVSRFAIADVFWRSGETKVDGWQVTQSTIDLFREEYQVPLLPPEVAAYMAAIQEHLFSVLLVIGLASRLSALGLVRHDHGDPAVRLSGKLAGSLALVVAFCFTSSPAVRVRCRSIA